RGARAARLPRDHHAGARLHARCRREEGRRLHRPVRARPGARLLPALRHAVAGGAAARPPWPLMVETLQNLALGFSIALTPGVLFSALAIAAVGSYVAGTVSVVALMVLAPPLASFALRFGPPEYFALLVLGLLVLAYMSGGSMLKALAMAALGLLGGMIGIDQMSGYF